MLKVKRASQLNFRRKVLYITYDGILEPLGQSQVLRYLTRLAEHHDISLISFEKPQDWADTNRRHALERQISDANVTWVPLRYHKRPSALATAFDIVQGCVVGTWLLFRHRVEIVHARSYVSSVIALVLKKLFAVKYIFDMRGFWADERVDGGIWPVKGGMYRAAKWFERKFLMNADIVVSLTNAAVTEMRTFTYLQRNMPRFEVITTCADLDLFRYEDLNIDHLKICSPSPIGDTEFTLGYVGSVGGWYLFDEALRSFKILCERIPNTQLRILNRGEHDYIRERMEALDIDPNRVKIEVADAEGVARAMQKMDAGIFFIRPIYSKTASAPTKLGEFLGCGVPCLGNSGVGDMAAILEGEKVGIAVSSFDDQALRAGIDQLLKLVMQPDIKIRCREAALKNFSLEDGVRSYDRIYRDLESGVA